MEQMHPLRSSSLNRVREEDEEEKGEIGTKREKRAGRSRRDELIEKPMSQPVPVSPTKNKHITRSLPCSPFKALLSPLRNTPPYTTPTPNTPATDNNPPRTTPPANTSPTNTPPTDTFPPNIPHTSSSPQKKKNLYPRGTKSWQALERDHSSQKRALLRL